MPRCACRAGRRRAAGGPRARSASPRSSTAATSAVAGSPQRAGSTATPAATSAASTSRRRTARRRRATRRRGRPASARGTPRCRRRAAAPTGRVVAVVVDLLDRLGGDRRERLVGAGRQAGVELALVGREHQQPRHRDARSRRWALDQLHVEEVALVAQVGEVVLGARPSPSTLRRRTRAASAPGRAGRARCWPSATSSSSCGAPAIHSPSRCAETSASSPTARATRQVARSAADLIALTGAPPLRGCRRTSGAGRPCRRPGRRTRPSRPGSTP